MSFSRRRVRVWRSNDKEDSEGSRSIYRGLPTWGASVHYPGWPRWKNIGPRLICVLEKPRELKRWVVSVRFGLGLSAFLVFADWFHLFVNSYTRSVMIKMAVNQYFLSYVWILYFIENSVNFIKFCKKMI